MDHFQHFPNKAFSVQIVTVTYDLFHKVNLLLNSRVSCTIGLLKLSPGFRCHWSQRCCHLCCMVEESSCKVHSQLDAVGLHTVLVAKHIRSDQRRESCAFSKVCVYHLAKNVDLLFQNFWSWLIITHQLFDMWLGKAAMGQPTRNSDMAHHYTSS